MSYLKEEIRYLLDFLTTYKTKIKALNSVGLFDEAKLFEGFAIDVCNILFSGRSFKNLNESKPNFPYFDLISSDEEIYVQVSTQKNCIGKIKKTLENYASGSFLHNSNVKTIKFFLLEKCNLKTIKSKTIKGIKFVKTKDIITLDDLIKKISCDTNFCHKLYDLISCREKNVGVLSAKASEAIKNSKITIDKSVLDKINNETHIERIDLIQGIKKITNKCVLVLGDAGSGKSSLVKHVLQDEKIVLYVRGEELSKRSKYLDLWGFDVEKIADFLKNETINIFVDSLEYVVGSNLSTDVLIRLLSVTEKLDYIKIYLTCRKNDLIALQYLLKTFDIGEFNVGPFNEKELEQIKERYSFVKQLSPAYSELFKLPFYANFIISNISELGEISDEDSLRKNIFEVAICLKNKCKEMAIDYYQVIKTVETIARDRSILQALYVDKTKYDYRIINNLLSAAILVEQKNAIRFSFDIFEDIVFEHLLDSAYDKSQADLPSFFAELDSLGDSCFRRYHTWISNKLKSSNFNSVIYSILCSDIDNKWVDQTRIALAVSNNSNVFLNNYLKTIENDKVLEMIRMVNLNAFNVDFDKEIFDVFPYLTLIPVGAARSCLVNYVFHEYKNNKIDIDNCDVISLIIDCDRDKTITDETKQQIVFLCENIISKHLNEDDWSEKESELITVIFNENKLCLDWLKSFAFNLLNSENDFSYYNREFINDLLSFKPERGFFKGSVGAFISDFFFAAITKKQKSHYTHLRGYKFGLNEMADDIDLNRTKPSNSSCFFQIIKGDFIAGLALYIKIMNHIAEEAKARSGIISIHDFEADKDYEFINYDELYFAGWFDESGLPYLVQDIAYLTINETKIMFDYLIKNAKGKVKNIANNVKRIVFKTANNVGPLSIIVMIWNMIVDIFPEYADNLITDHALIFLDIGRYARTIPNEKADYLKRVIAQSVGLPDFEKRFQLNLKPFDLRNVFFKSQITTKNTSVIDFCYKKYAAKSTMYNTYELLDVRKARITKLNDGLLIEGYKSGQKTFSNPIEDAKTFLSNQLSRINRRMNCLDEAEELCDYISKLDPAIQSLFENELMLFYVYILSCDALTIDRRNEVCQILIKKYEYVLNSGQIPIFDGTSIMVLFKQIYQPLNDDVSKRIKKLILRFLMVRSPNNYIKKIQDNFVYVFQNDLEYRNRYAYSLIELAKEEKKKAKYNLNIAMKIANDESLNEFVTVSDSFISSKGYEIYKIDIDGIIDRMLINSEKPTIEADISEYDIHTLISAIRFFNLNDDNLFKLYKHIISLMLDIIEFDEYSEIISVDESFLCSNHCSSLLFDKNFHSEVIELLFEYLSSHEKNGRSLDWVIKVFVSFVPSFFDEKEDRLKYFKYLKEIEKRINALSNEFVKDELRTIFVFNSTTSYFGDWSKINVDYSDVDLIEMMKLFSKYSYLHPQLFFSSIYRLHYEKMMPNIIVPVSDCLNKCQNYKTLLKDSHVHYVIKSIVFIGYVKHLADIKRNINFRRSFENILVKMSEIGDAVSLPLLNNLRIS